jgi:N-acetylmuramate 1-kinase
MSMTFRTGIESFLKEAGWSGANVRPLPGDASFRRYFRVKRFGGSAMLMDAPPPQEDVVPFMRVARWLDENGLRAPKILAADPENGFVLLEDFGSARMRDYLEEWPDDELETYKAAVDTLVRLRLTSPGPFLDYSMSEYMREARLFVDWYCTSQNLYVDGDGFVAAWEQVLGEVLVRQRPGVTVLRDYHAENIMLLGSLQKQGLLDFQDALVGHPAYDLVSLLQDARRDVSPELETEMFDYYLNASGDDPEQFLEDYAKLGAQRNTKIVGIFVRLWRRDNKPQYLDLIPRVWGLLERDLTHPALEPVARWFDANIPQDQRAAGGGSFGS